MSLNRPRNWYFCKITPTLFSDSVYIRIPTNVQFIPGDQMKISYTLFYDSIQWCSVLFLLLLLLRLVVAAYYTSTIFPRFDFHLEMTCKIRTNTSSLSISRSICFAIWNIKSPELWNYCLLFVHQKIMNEQWKILKMVHEKVKSNMILHKNISIELLIEMWSM